MIQDLRERSWDPKLLCWPKKILMAIHLFHLFKKTQNVSAEAFTVRNSREWKQPSIIQQPNTKWNIFLAMGLTNSQDNFQWNCGGCTITVFSDYIPGGSRAERPRRQHRARRGKAAPPSRSLRCRRAAPGGAGPSGRAPRWAGHGEQRRLRGAQPGLAAAPAAERGGGAAAPGGAGATAAERGEERAVPGGGEAVQGRPRCPGGLGGNPRGLPWRAVRSAGLGAGRPRERPSRRGLAAEPLLMSVPAASLLLGPDSGVCPGQESGRFACRAGLKTRFVRFKDPLEQPPWTVGSGYVGAVGQVELPAPVPWFCLLPLSQVSRQLRWKKPHPNLCHIKVTLPDIAVTSCRVYQTHCAWARQSQRKVNVRWAESITSCFSHMHSLYPFRYCSTRPGVESWSSKWKLEGWVCCWLWTKKGVSNVPKCRPIKTLHNLITKKQVFTVWGFRETLWVFPSVFCPVAILRAFSSSRNASPENPVEDFNFVKELHLELHLSWVSGEDCAACYMIQLSWRKNQLKHHFGSQEGWWLTYRTGCMHFFLLHI